MRYIELIGSSIAGLIAVSLGAYPIAMAFGVLNACICALYITREVKVGLLQHTSTVTNLRLELSDIKLNHENDQAKLEQQLEQLRISETIAQTRNDELAARCIDLNFNCAYCDTPQVVPYNPNEPQFTCTHCNQTNAVYTNIRHARITDSMDSAVDKFQPTLE